MHCEGAPVYGRNGSEIGDGLLYLVDYFQHLRA